MIYTLGMKSSYDESFKHEKQPMKLGPIKSGPDKGYPGGYAFENPLAAYDHMQQNKKTTKGYEVYGLKGVWLKDVYWSKKDGLFLTNKDLKLVQL